MTFTLFLSLLFSLFAQAKEILIIGDSLTCGPFGDSFHQGFQSNSDTVFRFCATSSAPRHWLQGKNPPSQKCYSQDPTQTGLKLCNGTGKVPPVQEILALHKNAEVIIALGTNSLYDPQVDQTYADLAALIRANGNKCFWVGPPAMNPPQARGQARQRELEKLNRNLPAFYESLTASVSSACEVVDSRPATNPGTPGNDTSDGVHRTRAGGIAWSKDMLAQLIPPLLAGFRFGKFF